MGADAELRALLANVPGAVVAAFDARGTLVPLPATVPLEGHQQFDGTTGLDLIVPADQRAVADAWMKIDEEPVLTVPVHLLADPDQEARIHLFDVRDEYGVHVLVFEGNDPDLVARSSDVRASLRRGTARVKRDGVSRFTEVDDAMTDLLGWTPEQLIGRSTVELVHPDDAEAAIETWMEMRAGAVSRRVRARMRHANGNYVWLEVSNDNHLNDPELECVITEFVDISAEMAQIEALQERERLLARLAEALPIGICQLRATREVVYCNEPLIELLGPIEHIDTMFRRVARRDRRALELALDHAFAGGSGSVEVGVITDVDERRCELTFRAMVNDDGTIDGVIVCAADVTDRSRLRAELEHRASHDALTGCLNRAATAAEVERMLCEGRHVAIVFIDLDDFKAINDDIGHAAGDELLRVAAGRLRSVARSDDVLGRLGGDEFVVVCGSTYSQLDPDALAERFASGVNGDVVFAGQRVTLRASVGAALSVTGESDVEGLFHRADVAMYAAKRRARAGAGGLH